MRNLSVRSHVLDSASAAWEFLSRGAQGWYTTPAQAAFWRQEAPAAPERRVLDGESVSADRNTSFHLRYLGDATWQATQYQVSGDGVPCEVEEHSLLANHDDLATLNYQVAWHERPQAVGGTFSALEPWFARFTGFGGK
jgi:hypothetical protein